MKRLSSLFVALLLSCQLSFAAAFESFNVAANEVHQVFSHDHFVDHHHLDAFSADLDHLNGDHAHQHFNDNLQTSALLPFVGAFLAPPNANVPLVSHPNEPPIVFLDGLLRPPRLKA
jgi:hypothetical protein